MNKYMLLFLLFVTIFSCNSYEEIIVDDNESEPQALGAIEGFVRMTNEYGLHPFGLEQDVIIHLLDSNQEIIKSLTKSVDDRTFQFDSLNQENYYLFAESPDYSSCQLTEIEISQEHLFLNKELEIRSEIFTAKLNSVQVDSLVGNRLYHSFDIDKISDKSIEVRFYLSDDPTVSNQNYKESLRNLAAWASPETSGQYKLFLEMTPELYEGDSIYASVYLVNLNSEECIGDNGLIFHAPFSEESITIGFKK